MNKKNVIWFFPDQLRSSALSVNGDNNAITPNIDNLALQGINYVNAVSPSPLCTPFRGTLLTGKYSHKSSVPHNQYRLNKELPLISDIFNEAGYETTYIGKWHLYGGKDEEVRLSKLFIPKEERGRFTNWIGYENNNSQYDTYVHGHMKDEEIEMYRLPKFETDALVDIAIEKINDSKKNEKPFFMVLSVQPPHRPYIPPQEYRKNFSGKTIELRENVPNNEKLRQKITVDLRGYYGLIENLDYNLGRIIECLEENEIKLDTHIIVFSDHGDMLGSHGLSEKNNPYQESINIPLIIGGESPMRYHDRGVGNNECVISGIDIPPTTLGLCGLDIPDWMQGHDYSHHRLKYKVAKEDEKSVFIQSMQGEKFGEMTDKPWRAIVTKDQWKYACFENSEWVMFDLKNDPYEMVNLVHISKYKEKKKELNLILKNWIDKIDDKFDLPEFN